MPRNFDRRIEIAFPVIEPRLQTKLKEILELQLADNTKAWWMRPDGTYVRSRQDDKPAFRFQERFYTMVQAEHASDAHIPFVAGLFCHQHAEPEYCTANGRCARPHLLLPCDPPRDCRLASRQGKSHS